MDWAQDWCRKWTWSPSRRSGSCKLKLEKFRWEINYRFLIRRAITFPRDVVHSPPFKSFNTGQESFSKKKPHWGSTTGLLALTQELQMSQPGLGEREVGAEGTFLMFSDSMTGFELQPD